MRSALIGARIALALAVPLLCVAPGCGSDNGSSSSSSGGTKTDGGVVCNAFGCTSVNGEGGVPPAGCTGLACSQVTNCPPSTSTTLTGHVFDPAGKVPIYNVVVYVPNGPLTPITDGLGATCDRCDGSVSGAPIAITLTDASGAFTLPNVPAGVSFPLVMQIGKWRRTVTIPAVGTCQSAAADPATTRLPKNHTEGDIPRIALATGSANPLECLLRKVGLDDSEFGVAGSDARVHLYTGGSTAPATATSSFAAGGSFGDAPTALWDKVDDLKKYDIVMLSCEGDEKAAEKPVTARQALYDYSVAGGRVFASHYHHYWFSNSPVPAVKNIATWVNDFTCTGASCPPFITEPAPDVTVDATVNTSFAKGQAMHDWLKNVNALDGPNDTLPIKEGRDNVDAVSSNALSWMTIANPASTPAGRTAHEYVSFNTPVGASDDQVCGRVVYSDLHVGAGDATGKPFPSGCTTPDLTEQQKALEFMLFDLSSCIAKDDETPSPPK